MKNRFYESSQRFIQPLLASVEYDDSGDHNSVKKADEFFIGEQERPWPLRETQHFLNQWRILIKELCDRTTPKTGWYQAEMIRAFESALAFSNFMLSHDQVKPEPQPSRAAAQYNLGTLQMPGVP